MFNAGHNGRAAAEFSAASMPDLFHSELDAALRIKTVEQNEAVHIALTKGAANIAEKWLLPLSLTPVLRFLRAAFLETDRKFIRASPFSGCTCTVLIQVGWHLTVACVGDSRAVADDGSKVRRILVLELYQIAGFTVKQPFSSVCTFPEKNAASAASTYISLIAEFDCAPCVWNTVSFAKQ